MATWPVTTVGAPLGLQPDPEHVRVINRTGSATVVGEIVQFDLASTTTEVTTINGGDDGVLGSVITPVTAELSFGWFGVCTEIAADNVEMKVVIRGKVQALVSGANAAALTDYLTPANASTSLTSDVVANGAKIVARPLEVTAGATAELVYVVFDGIYGFGAAPDQ